MGKLISPLKIRGTIDDLCFRLTDDGVIVQSKPGPTSEQVRTGKTFDLTRRNAREFGRATKDAMLLRRSLDVMVRAVKHSKLNSHVNKRLHKIAKSDVRRKKNLFPAAATHFRIVSCAGSVDFNQQRFSSNIAKSELLPLGKKTPALQLQHSLQAQPGQVMLHTAGIVFYKVEDGEETLLRGGALKIVQVARKEKVVATPVTGTPAHTAMPHTCANNPKTDQPAIAVSVANNPPPEQAAVPPKTRKPTRLRGYYTSRKREAVRMSGLSR